MLVATFASCTGWVGRRITYENGQFVLQDHGVIPLEGVLDYDRLGQLDWVSAEMRAWAFALAQWAGVAAPQGAPGQPAGQSYVPAYHLQTGAPQYGPAGVQPHGPAGVQPQYAPPYDTRRYPPPQAGAAYAPQPAAAPASHGLPVWAIILIVVAVLVFVGGTVAAVLIPMTMVSQFDEQANEITVKNNARSLKVAIESYAAEMNGSYPATANEVTLGRYLSTWPTNPYTDAPMTEGASPGNYSYLPSTGGRSYQLVAYGADGEVIITLGSDSGIPTI